MIAIIGGGPAGLMAAETAASAGAEVTLFDAKASVGRKFLVAGGGGLNLTKQEAPATFATRYRGPDLPPDFWPGRMEEFGPAESRAWAAGLGIETFVASTKRVYPSEMKAAPLLRRWVERLRRLGVRFALHHRWTGWQGDALVFQTPDGLRTVVANAAILALGGGSWPETGSDGVWTIALDKEGIAVIPLQPANCGWELPWTPEVLALAEGEPLKNVSVRAGEDLARGELLITRYGLEGGALYQLGAALRAMPHPEIAIDLKPDLSLERVVEKLGPAKRNWAAEASRRLKLSSGAAAILAGHRDAETWSRSSDVAATVKACRLALIKPRPMAEAISSAGGVAWTELEPSLMLRKRPGVFVAGEMIDWEAPTGGYLLQGALATGRHAAQGALTWLQNQT